jgi:tellurite resistance protein
MNNLPWQISKIIDVANELQATGSTAASTSERIAAAFVLNNQHHLPDSYSDILEAWDRLGDEWQQHVRIIKRDYMHLIEGA